MLTSRSGSSSSSGDKIFNGVRFVLFGFDSVSEAQYRDELVRRGATDVGKHDHSCTHVIVSGRVADDPVCVAARQDGKILVTEIWIDDSVDFGILADASRVLYRPVKDLTGIPGSESLYICLTGYQRQEREDIMKMVSLMGARFSKPLIANQVTHLICYKFEGEKYELAKKVKIKLVNHRWLEDCLKAWEILPVDNYAKSGWDLEVLEAEAKDSEEETEDPGTELLGQRRTGDHTCLIRETSIGASSHVYTPNKRSTINQDASGANMDHAAESLLANQRGCTPNKETCFREDTYYKQNMDITVKDLEIGHKEAGIIAQTSGHQNLDYVRNKGSSTPPDVDVLTKSNVFASDVLTGKMDPTSGRLDERSSTSCNSKKTREKKGTREEPSNSCREDFNENISSEDLNIHTESTKGCKAGHFQSPTASGDLPQKRKVSDLGTGSKSPRIEGECSKFSPRSHSTNMGFEQREPTSALSINDSRAATNGLFEGVAKTNSKENQRAAPTKFISLSYRRSHKRDQPTSEAKTSKTVASLSVGTAQSGQSKEALDQPPVITNNSVECNASGPVIRPSSDMVIRDLPRDVGPKKAMDVGESFKKVGSGLDSLVIDDRSRDLHPSKEKVLQSFHGLGETELVSKSGSSGDTVMEEASKFITNGNGEQQGRHQVGGASASPSRESESRKLSSTATTITCKETASNDSFGVRMKKVVSRSNFLKPKVTAVSTKKDKGIRTSNKATTTKKLGAKPTEVEKMNAEMEPEKAADNEKKDSDDLVSKDVVMERHIGESSIKKKAVDKGDGSVDPEKENKPKPNRSAPNVKSHPRGKVLCEDIKTSRKQTERVGVLKNSADQASRCAGLVDREPAWFILSGHPFQRKEFRIMIKNLKGRVCRDSHNWSYQATHFIVPDPVRRIEKFFAAAAAGRWILKTDYLTASTEAGKLLDEEPFEWYRKGLTEDGAINLEAPRKWRCLREKTGNGAFYGMRIVIYGDCIAPSLDTLKRVVKAGGGTILATSPPYTRLLNSGVDYAIVSSCMPVVDSWVQEFLRHEIPCVVADYLVEYVCKPGYSLERHVLYNTHPWAERSFANLLSRSEEIVTVDSLPPEESSDDASCSVCGSCDRGEVMLICGDEGGAVGCGVGAHIDCCDPPLGSVPEGDWFCPRCSKVNEPKTPLRSSKRKSASKRK